MVGTPLLLLLCAASAARSSRLRFLPTAAGSDTEDTNNSIKASNKLVLLARNPQTR